MKSLFKSRTLRHSSVKLMSLFDRLCAQSYSALLLGSITKSWSHVVFSRDGVQQDQKNICNKILHIHWHRSFEISVIFLVPNGSAV